MWSEDWERANVSRLKCDVKSRAQCLFISHLYSYLYAKFADTMSSSDASPSCHSDTAESSDAVYSCQFQPYQDEPLVHRGDDIMEENSDEEARNEDGLTPAILESRFDRTVTFGSW